MKPRITLIKSSWGMLLIGTLSLGACATSNETGVIRSNIVPPRTIHYTAKQEVMAEPPDVSPSAIPVSTKYEPKHKVYGNKYWHKLNRGIKDALPSYSADKYMKEETATTHNIKPSKSSGKSNTLTP